MSNRKLDITRRKVLAGIGAAGLAGAGAGFGTSAVFSDEEAFEGNTLAAGELDLKVDWEEHYSYPQLYGMDDPTAELSVTRSPPENRDAFVGLPDPSAPVVWVHEDDLGAYMANTAIEAFPDPDNDGMQEVMDGEFTYEPCTDGADLPEDLGSSLRTDNAATNNGDEIQSPDPLINLHDVKPGDFGEFTFSFHLCDNPGYVWLRAANVSSEENGVQEPEPDEDDTKSGELGENIQTIWWYDARGDNVPPRQNCTEQLYLTDTGGDDATELYEVTLDDATMEAELTLLLPNDPPTTDIVNGNFNQTDAIAATPNGDQVIFYDKESTHIGVYDVATGSFVDRGEIGDSGGDDPSGVVLAGYAPSGQLWAASQDDDHLYTVDPSTPAAFDRGDTGIDLSGADLAFASDGTMYIWTSDQAENGLYKVDDPSSDTTAVAVSSDIGDLPTDVTGMAIREGGSGDLLISDNQSDEVIIVDRTDGSLEDGYQMVTADGESFDHIFGDMTAGQLCGEVFRRGTLAEDLDLLTAGLPLDGNRASGFDHLPGNGASSARECFAAGVTHYIGFGWWLPADIGSEVQSDSISFDLGFYTEQCRNNDGSLS